VSSVQASPTTTISQSSKVCARALSIAIASTLLRLYVETTMETVGCLSGTPSAQA
jgi:hypothetical protein